MTKSAFKREMEYQAFVIPSFLIYTIFCMLPLVFGIFISFTNWDGFSSQFHFIGLQNYAEALFHSDYVLPALGRTVLYALVVTALFTLVAIPLALVLDSRVKLSKLYRGVFFFPSVPSMLVIGYMWTFLMRPRADGLINSAIGLLGITPVNWLGDNIMANVSILIVSVWCYAGWHAIIYIANLQSISEEYYEAAKIDGANFWQSFLHITFPLLTPAMSISILFSLTGAFKMLDLPFSLTGGGPGYSTHFVVQTIIEKGIQYDDFGLASALSVLLIVLLIAVSIAQQFIMGKREERLS